MNLEKLFRTLSEIYARRGIELTITVKEKKNEEEKVQME